MQSTIRRSTEVYENNRFPPQPPVESSLYLFLEDNGGLFGKKGDKGMITALNVYDVGQTDWNVVLTGGSGSYTGASGEVGVTYDGTKYILTYSVCP